MGAPVTLTSTSGNLAQPVAGANVQPWALAPTTRPACRARRRHALSVENVGQRESRHLPVHRPVGLRAGLGVRVTWCHQPDGGHTSASGP